MALTKIDDRGLTTPIDLLDSEKIRFGTGNDLAIYHDGSYNRFTGASYVFMNAAANEYLFEGFENGAVKLYYDNSKKFETTSTGVKYTGDLRADDDYRIKLGTSQELNIYHHNTGSSLIENTNQTLKLRAKAGEDAVVITPDGSVDLYYDNSKKLETHTTGVVVHGNISPDNLYLGDNEKAYFGDGSDLQLYHDGSNSYIEDGGTGYLILRTSGLRINNPANDEGLIHANADGAVLLYYDNVKKFETTNYGNSVHGHFDIATDGDKLRMGGSYDLEIWHSGNHAYLNNDTGNIALDSANDIMLRVASSSSPEMGLDCHANGSVDLYYDGSKKFETTSWGVDVHDTLRANDITLSDNYKLRVGTSDDLQIYHDGTVNEIRAVNGHLHIRSEDSIIFSKIDADGSNAEVTAKFLEDGACELYYDAVLAFKTGSNGNYFYKHCDPYVADSFNLGHNYRWKTLYTNNAVDVSSDRNTKNTIIDSDLGLSFINQLRPVSFKKNNQGDSIHYGLIAQEVEDVIINTGKSLEEFSAISKPTDKTMGLAYSEFISPLIKAVQELTTKVETLETEVAALKAK